MVLHTKKEDRILNILRKFACDYFYTEKRLKKKNSPDHSFLYIQVTKTEIFSKEKLVSRDPYLSYE